MEKSKASRRIRVARRRALEYSCRSSRSARGATACFTQQLYGRRRIFSVEIHAPGISFFGDPEEGGTLYADNKLDPIEELDPFAMANSQADYRAFGAYEMNRHFVNWYVNR